LYAQAARQRIDAVVPVQVSDLDVAPTSTPRIPFRKLLELGLLEVGQSLYLVPNGEAATILPTGALRHGELTGSIHGLAARLKGVPSCNGWMNWQVDDGETGERVLLDVLRKRVADQ
jgi:modification methylase